MSAIRKKQPARKKNKNLHGISALNITPVKKSNSNSDPIYKH